MFKFIHPYAFGHRRSGSLSGIARRTVTLMAVLGAGVAVMGAQTDSHPQASLSLQVPAMAVFERCGILVERNVERDRGRRYSG